MNELTTSLGYGLSALTWVVTGLLLLSRRPTASSRPTLFWLLAAVIGECAWAIHALPSVSVQMPPWLGAALHALRFLLFSAFMLALLRGLRDQRILVLAAGLAMTLAIAQGLGAVIQTPLMIQQTLALLAALFCILCVEQVYRNAVPDQRWLLKFACLATFLLFAFEALLRADALLHGGVDPTLLTAQGFVDALIAPLMAVGGLRLLPTKQHLRFSRDAVFHTATLLVSGLFLLSMAAIGYGLRIFGSTWGAVLQWILLFAAAITLLVLLGSGHVRAQLRVWINKHFFSQRYDYRKEWMRLTSLLSGSSSLEDQKRATAARGLQALVDMVESTGGQIWTQDVAGAWRLRARLNVHAGPDLAAHDSLADFLGSSGWIIDIDDWRDGRAPQGCPPMVGWLKSDSEAWLLMAISVQSVPVALVQLQRPLAPIPLDWEVRDLLKAAGQQVAGLLRTEQALESLVQARQFDSFNRMSAFVVHDLKNLVAQLGLMLKNAERHRDNPQFQADMLETAAHVQERMQSMLLQLRDGTRPIEAVQPVDLDACLERVVQRRPWPDPQPQLLLESLEERSEHTSGTATFQVQVLAHADRLERVIGHLIQNGIEASETRSPVQVRRRVESGQAVIEVIDRGRGMSADFVSDELFKPFRTTKAHGMGIGAFESREYIHEIGGVLVVRSSPGQGSTFSIRIPLRKESP